MDDKARKITEVAARLGVNAAQLDALINFETGGSYSVYAANPTSSAKGLIQVIDSTARSEFHVPDSLALVNKYPTFDAYMDNVVYPYLVKYAPFKDKQSLYMAVFYPAYRNMAPTTEFPPSVQEANKGIRTIQDYIDYVDKRVKNPLLPKALPLLLIVVVGVGLYWLLGTGRFTRRYRRSSKMRRS